MTHPADYPFPANVTICLENFREGIQVFEDEIDFAVITQSPDKSDHFYVGIVRDYHFTHGPFIARQDQIWEKLRKINPKINGDDLHLSYEREGPLATSLDDLIDIMGTPPEKS